MTSPYPGLEPIGSTPAEQATAAAQAPPLPAPSGPAVPAPAIENACEFDRSLGQVVLDKLSAYMGVIPWPGDGIEYARLWQTLYIAGEAWPGVTRIKGAGGKRNIEEKQASGDDGATITDKGRARPKFTIETTIWTSRQWYEVQRLLPLIEPNKDGGPRSPLGVYHPALELFGITQIYIDTITLGDLTAEGTMTITMNAGKWAHAPAPAPKGAGESKAEVLDDLNKGHNSITGGGDKYHSSDSPATVQEAINQAVDQGRAKAGAPPIDYLT